MSTRENINFVQKFGKYNFIIAFFIGGNSSTSASVCMHTLILKKDFLICTVNKKYARNIVDILSVKQTTLGSL